MNGQDELIRRAHNNALQSTGRFRRRSLSVDVGSKMIEEFQDKRSRGLRARKIAAAILALLGIPGYYFCASHICMAGHMQHPPYPAWHFVADFVWVVLFAGAAALAILSNLKRKIMFALLLVFLIVSRLLVGSGGGGLFLLELPASLVIVAFAILGFRKEKTDTTSFQ